MVALLVVVVLDINVKNYQYSAKKRKKKNQGLETSRVSSPILLPLPFLPLIDPSQLLLPLVLLVVVVIVFVLVVLVVVVVVWLPGVFKSNL